MSSDKEPFRIEGCGLEWFQIRNTTPFCVDIFLFVNELSALNDEIENYDAIIMPQHLDLLRRFGAPADITGQEVALVIKRVNDLLPKKKEEPSDSPSSVPSTDSTVLN